MREHIAGYITTVDVIGMHCEHCVTTDTELLSALDGVTSVDIALNPDGVPTATLGSEHPLDRAAIGAATRAAGYALARRGEPAMTEQVALHLAAGTLEMVALETYGEDTPAGYSGYSR